MATIIDRQKADATVQVRMPQQTKEMISTAAETVGKTLTAFIIESASQHAVDVLLDQRVFNLDEAATEAFLTALEAPAPANAKLQALATKRRTWE